MKRLVVLLILLVGVCGSREASALSLNEVFRMGRASLSDSSTSDVLSEYSKARKYSRRTDVKSKLYLFRSYLRLSIEVQHKEVLAQIKEKKRALARQARTGRDPQVARRIIAKLVALRDRIELRDRKINGRRTHYLTKFNCTAPESCSFSLS